jgi:hypothetical protein
MACLTALALSMAPRPAAAEFRCAASVDYHAGRCASSLITSIGKEPGAAVCTAFTDRLARSCRSDWDKFKTCRDFARRFEDLLVDACKDQKLPIKNCRAWGEAFAAGELTRCERGHFSY